MKEQIKWRTSWQIQKFRNSREAEPYAVEHFGGNVALEGGLQAICDMIVGDFSGEVFDETHARLGVGSDDTPANAEQAGLEDAGAVWKGMDAGYPQRNDESIVFRSTFEGGDANFGWEEYAVDNGDGVVLNRKVEGKGTKQADEVWILTLTLSFT